MPNLVLKRPPVNQMYILMEPLSFRSSKNGDLEVSGCGGQIVILKSTPPSCLEQKLTSWRHDTEGMSFWGAVVGHRASSTRTELAAGIVAAAASLPMHQATDSMAYKLKVNALLDGEDMTSRKPWSLQKD